MPRRQALVFGAAGCPAAVCCGFLSAAGIGLCGFVCRSFCRRRAASPPSSVSVSGGLPLRPRASRPSPSHRYAAGPSLYKRGCLRLRNSPAASRPSVLWPCDRLPCAKRPFLHTAPALRPPPVCKTALSAHGPGLRPPPVCKTALSAHGPCLRSPPVCKTPLSAHGSGLRLSPVCKTALSAHGSGLLASLAPTDGGLKGENDYLCGV